MTKVRNGDLPPKNSSRIESRSKCETLEERRGGVSIYRRESVAGVGNKHAGLANGPIADGDTLNKPRRAHLLPLLPSIPSQISTKLRNEETK